MHSKKFVGRLLRSTVMTSAFAAFAFPAFAQGVDQIPDADNSAQGEGDTIVVTGSRIARDEYTSPAPLQTLDTQAARQIGITSITELLQRSTVSNGQQIDGTLNTNSGNSNATEAPPVGGTGSANIGLRGLDPERTLILVNGKRLGSAGVRGAPAQPDINLLPLNLVQRIEVVTEGASAIYGADAVAGVVNVILRTDFEGLELSTNFEKPEHDGGETSQFSFLLGQQGDRAHVVIGGEYFDQNRIELRERIDCRRSLVQVASTGERLQECSNGFFDNIVADFTSNIPTGDIFAFYIPGLSAAQSDIGVPNFGSAFQLPLDVSEDGACERADQRCRFPFIPFYSDEQERLTSDLVQPLRRMSAVMMGGFDFDAFGASHELYFETYYFNRLSKTKSPTEQIFPTIPGQIPQEDASGNIIVDGTGAPILVDNPLNPFPGNATPILTLEGNSQDRNVEVTQYRFVGGLKGDIPNMGDKSWTYDTFFTYDRSIGFASQALLNETNLNLALNTLRLDSSGNPICGVPFAANDFGFLTGQECVPINFFADSVFTGGEHGEGVFSTDAENNFLFGQRTNRTVVEQILFGGYLSGDLFELPAGTVKTALGGEWRRDRINSAADFLSSHGDNAAENSQTEEPTVGERDIWDLYGEVVVPLIDGGSAIDSWTVEGAVRYTSEQNFGDEVTYRARSTFGLNDWITLSGSYGTSFRAPNLREQFLAPQQEGTSSRNDPCTIPAAANVGGVYVPSLDTRTQTVLDNCVADGADPTQLGLTATVTIPVTVGGNASDLKPETSRAYTATLQLKPPLSDNFDLSIAASFFDIKVKDNIRSLSPETLMARCFDSVGLTSDLCPRLQRKSTGNPRFDFISFIDASFVNVGVERSQGIDLNTRLTTTLGEMLGEPLDLMWSNAVTFQTKRSEQIFSDDPTDNLLGDYGMPKTRLQSTFAFTSGNWDAVFDTRYIQGTGPSQDALSNVDFQCPGPNGVPAISTSYPGSPNVFLICSAGGRVYEDASLTYHMNNVSITGGIRNIFDNNPPLISAGLGSNRGGRVTSSGYDQFGRTFFFTVTGAF